MSQRARNPETGQEIEWDGTQWVPVPSSAPPQAPPAPTSSMGTGILRGINRGASLGLSEILIPGGVAGYRALTEGAPFGEAYAEEKASRAAEQGQFSQEHFWPSLLSEGAGGGMLGAAGGMRASLGGLMSKIGTRHPFLASIPIGGALGGIYGRATALPGEELSQTMQGAGIGAAAGPVGWLVGRGVSKAIEGGRRAMTPKAARIFAREVLEPAGMTADEVAGAMQERGWGTTPLEVTGTSGIRAAQGVTGRSPAAAQRIRNVVDRRLAGRWTRMKADMRRILGKEGGRYFREFEGIKKARADQAKPFYEAAWDDEVPVQAVANLDKRWYQMLTEGLPDERIAALQGTTYERYVRQARKKLLMGGKPAQAKTGVMDLDIAKRELDDLYIKAKSPTARRIITKMKHDLTDLTDAASPNYKKARAIYSSDSDMMDAMELGRKVLREDAEITQMALERMSLAERDAYLVGAAKALRDAVGSKPPQFFYRHGGIQERLAFAFPDKKSMDEFINVSLTREAKLGELSTKILHDSQTQPRQQATRNLAMAFEDLAEGQQSAASMRVLRFLKLAKGDYSEETLQQLTNLLVEDNPERFVEQASKVLRPEDFAQMRRAITGAGTVMGAEAPQPVP